MPSAPDGARVAAGTAIRPAGRQSSAGSSSLHFLIQEDAVQKFSMPSWPKLPAAGVLVLALCSWSIAAPAVDFSKYHNYAELTAALQSLVKEHPTISQLVEVGKTRENRSIWAVEIMNAPGPASPTRPALLVAANFEADHLVGSELAIFMIDY